MSRHSRSRRQFAHRIARRTGLLAAAVLVGPVPALAQNCKSAGNLYFVGTTTDETHTVWLSATRSGPFRLETAQQSQFVDEWVQVRARGLHLSVSPFVSNGNGGTHKLLDLSDDKKPCQVDTANQQGGFSIPTNVSRPWLTPPFGRPPIGHLLPNLLPDRPAPPIATLPPSGVMPPLPPQPPSGVMPTLPPQPPSGLMPTLPPAPPSGVMPTLPPAPPSGVMPTLPPQPPSGVMPTLPPPPTTGPQPVRPLAPPSGSLPNLLPDRPAPPIATLPPSGVMPTLPPQPPSGVMPTLPPPPTTGPQLVRPLAPPSGSLPNLLPDRPAPPIATLPPSGVMPTLPPAPPSGVMPTLPPAPPSGVMPTLPPQPPSGVMPTLPPPPTTGPQPVRPLAPPSGSLPNLLPDRPAPPIATLPPSGVMPTLPPQPPSGLQPTVPGALVPPPPEAIFDRRPEAVFAAEPGLAAADYCVDRRRDPRTLPPDFATIPWCPEGVEEQLPPTLGGVPLTAGRDLQPARPWNVWAEMHANGTTDRRFGLDMHADSLLVSVGIDRALGDGVVLGMSFGYQESDSDSFAETWLTEVSTINAGPYLAVRLSDDWATDFSGTYTASDIAMNLVGLEGQIDSHSIGGAAGLHGNLQVGRLIIRPSATVSYTHASTDAYQLRGQLFGRQILLDLDDSSANSGNLELTTEVSQLFATGTGTLLVPYFEVGANYAFERSAGGAILTGDLTMAFPSAWAFTARGGLRVLLSNAISLEAGAAYLSIGQDGLDQYEGMLRVSFGF